MKDESRTSEFFALKCRLKAAAEAFRPGLGDELGAMPGATMRARVNELTGAEVPNSPPMECMRQLAEALEAKVSTPEARRP